MATKMAKATIPGVHTAGIYADMTVDGPEIGTLVVIVDRAKNLPNRKTMGKQDPYCAARLGKEAKKTETDKRGGQTPRWDQELRFTVHDSPDYHQLKVSVFNDDKKTDLIGETWVPLDRVVVPGGGTSDIWHSLNCKGRYAGEIRIELTYYDTRPKEEKMQETTEVSYPNESHERANEKLGGVRHSQPKAVKRRPLPADPTSADLSPLRPAMPDHAQSSPLPYTPPRQSHHLPGTGTAPQSLHGSMPRSNQAGLQPPNNVYGTSPSPQYHPRYTSGVSEEPTYTTNRPEQSSLPQNNQHFPTYNDQHLYDVYPDPHQASNSARSQAPYPEDFEKLQAHNNQSQHTNYGLEIPQFPPYSQRSARPAAQSSQVPYMHNGSQSNSMPSYPQQPTQDVIQEPRYQPEPFRQPGLSSLSGDMYQESPLRPRSLGNRHSIQYAPYHPTVEDEDPLPLPPPPPAHRSTGGSAMVTYGENNQRHHYPPITAPAPLNIKRSRGDLAISPLSQGYQELPGDGYNISTSPPSAVSPSTMAPIPTYNDYKTPGRQQSQDSQRGQSFEPYSIATPPTLVAGYDPAVAEAESQRMWEERHALSSSMPSNMAPQYTRPPVDENRWDSQLVQYNSITASTHVENFQGREVHRHSVPVVKPKAMSPDPRTPMRKSVSPHPDPRRPIRKSISPHPEPSPREGSLIDAFSPDSYEVLNPNLKSASSINASGPKYNTPEQAREAFREKEKEKRLEEGPIIGSDGKEIDPSDHLPTDTWAPEPERKTPRRGPEITLRFRQSPQGAQPMPASAPRPPRETVIRPHSIATTVHSYSMDSVSPTVGVRNRLQKKPRGSVPHANSSPTLPVSNGNSPLNYPLRERVNYGLDSSPTYARSSPLAPPPVPAKVPLASGQEDWERNSLAEEMRRIDIGVGNGSGGRVRRSRYGP